MRRITGLLIILTAMISIILPFCLDNHYYSLAFPLQQFSSYEELRNFLEASAWMRRLHFELQADTLAPLSLEMPPEVFGSLRTLYGLSESSGPEYSTTNTQVEGVDEADIVKTDGHHIYTVSDTEVCIVKAYPAEEAAVLSQLNLNCTVTGIFISEDELAVLAQGRYGPSSALVTAIKVYDISDRVTPILERSASMDGTYLSSRMIGDYVYALIEQPAALIENEVSLPRIHTGNRTEEIRASEVYYSDIPDYSYGFTTILAVNIHDESEEPTHETFLLGGTSSIYVSTNNLYVTVPESGRTLVYRFHLAKNEVEWMASGELPGHILNQFSMDEHANHFRVATTTGHIARTFDEATSQNNIYVLDLNLSIVGRLEDLAPGERIYSARFMGDRCYLVTFRKVDPLFVIDLEDPSNPIVLGQLKITGYSDYLHPYDENHLIGIGKETIAAEEGDFAWYQGVKISLFDITDVSNPVEIDKYEIGDRGTDSPLLRDHKALLFDRSRNLLVLPVLVAEINEARYPNGVPPNTSGEYTWQGVYIFDISLDGLLVRGRITHVEDEPALTSGHFFASSYEVTRSLYIDNALYTLSDKGMKINSLDNLDVLNQIELP